MGRQKTTISFNVIMASLIYMERTFTLVGVFLLVCPGEKHDRTTRNALLRRTYYYDKAFQSLL
jgi:hypothetical protein